MKKIIKKICRFIGKMILFIDKILITPIMKVVIKVIDFFKTHGKNVEKVLTTKSALLIISLSSHKVLSIQSNTLAGERY